MHLSIRKRPSVLSFVCSFAFIHSLDVFLDFLSSQVFLVGVHYRNTVYSHLGFLLCIELRTPFLVSPIICYNQTYVIINQDMNMILAIRNEIFNEYVSIDFDLSFKDRPFRQILNQ